MYETKSLATISPQASTNVTPVSSNPKTRGKKLVRSFAIGEGNRRKQLVRSFAIGEENPNAYANAKLSDSKNIIISNSPSTPTSPTSESSIKSPSNQQ